MQTRFSPKLDRLRARVLDGPGVLEPSVRHRAFEGAPLDDALADRYVANIRQHAYKIVERDVAELRDSGWSEDQIFELSVSAAFGAAQPRLDAALGAVEAAQVAGKGAKPDATRQR
jgi:hypothetical protein